MTAAILSIGTELTRGEIVNTNASVIADVLTSAGFEVTAIDTVDDDIERIRGALRRLGRDHTVVVSTGGLGPTTDDITSVCVAAELGVPLVRDAASLEAIRGRMERFGRVMAESNAKQADFPQGAAVLPNEHGTAPGFAVSIGNALAIFLPGVPREMKPMLEDHGLPLCRGRAPRSVSVVKLRTFGLPESTLNDRLAGIEADHAVTLAYRAHFPEIELKILARAGDHAARSRAAAAIARERLGEVVYAEGEGTFPAAIGALLRDRRMTIATAESCTGGLAAELLTDEAGSSAFFAGGVVAYANSAKTSLLGVDAALLAEHGAVSEPVARAMAEGARARFGTDVALSFTGVAGPSGGSAEKPVGLVHIALAGARGTESHHRQFPGSRWQIRRLATFAGLALVRKAVLEGGPSGTDP